MNSIFEFVKHLHEATFWHKAGKYKKDAQILHK